MIEAQNALLHSYEWIYVNSIHLITEQLNQLSIVNIFCPFATNYRKSSAIFKKLARSTPVSLDRRDRHTPARLPRSNEATGRVNKGQAVQPVYAGLTNVFSRWCCHNFGGKCNIFTQTFSCKRKWNRERSTFLTDSSTINHSFIIVATVMLLNFQKTTLVW